MIKKSLHLIIIIVVVVISFFLSIIIIAGIADVLTTPQLLCQILIFQMQIIKNINVILKRFLLVTLWPEECTFEGNTKPRRDSY